MGVILLFVIIDRWGRRCDEFFPWFYLLNDINDARLYPFVRCILLRGVKDCLFVELSIDLVLVLAPKAQ